MNDIRSDVTATTVRQALQATTLRSDAQMAADREIDELHHALAEDTMDL